MQIQSVNNTPAFQANHLRTAVKLAQNAGQHKAAIDIYSINKSDSEFINKLLLKLDLKDRADGTAVKEKRNINDTIRSVLTKALHLDEKSNDGVYMAVENGKRISGFLDYTNGGMPLIKSLVSWRGKEKNNVRMNLFSEFLHKVGIPSGEDIAVYAEPKSKGHKWLLEQGFTIPAQPAFTRQRLVMPQEAVIANTAKSDRLLEDNAGMKITQNSERTQIELTNFEL